MKHLDVIDGELAAMPSEQRPTQSIVGRHFAIIILQMRLQDAETAKFQTDLITTASRTQTQWGRPPPRRVFKQKKQNDSSHCTSRSTLFHTGKRNDKVVCFTCNMHCVVSLLFQLCRLGNGSGKRKTNSHLSTFKLLSISLE